MNLVFPQALSQRVECQTLVNKIERFVYDLVKRNLRIKFFLRDTCQTLFDLLPVSACRSAYPIKVRKGYFFGFHDHTPFSADNKLLLANHYFIKLRMPREDDKLAVSFFHGEDCGKWRPVGETRAWNWHKVASCSGVDRDQSLSITILCVENSQRQNRRCAGNTVSD